MSGEGALQLTSMNANSVHAILPAADLERAKTFYSEKLGLTPASEEPVGIFYEVGQTRFVVFPARGRPSGEHTQATFTVDDVEAAVSQLKERGVVFEKYDLPGLSTVNFGVGDRRGPGGLVQG
jgi:predicted enzyme related to lactoylglutathione lyase